MAAKLTAGFVLLTLLVFGSCKRDGTNSNQTVSVRFPIPIIEAGQAPFYVAQDKGYYGDEKIDVRFEMGSKELNPIKMVASGQDTFGVIGGQILCWWRVRRSSLWRPSQCYTAIQIFPA